LSFWITDFLGEKDVEEAVLHATVVMVSSLPEVPLVLVFLPLELELDDDPEKGEKVAAYARCNRL